MAISKHSYLVTVIFYLVIFFADERLKLFALRASVLGLILSMRLGGKKDIQSEKLAWPVLHAELKAHTLPPLWRSNKGCHTNTYIHTERNAPSEGLLENKSFTKESTFKLDIP